MFLTTSSSSNDRLTSPFSMSPSIKLTYFHGTGRAEFPRLIFHFGGVAFEDERIGYPTFTALKPSLPLGQVPVLEVDGVTYSQSMAIARYVAKLAGLFPEDPLLALGVDMISETLNELAEPVSEIMFRTKDEALKAEKTKVFLDVTMPKRLAVLESKVQGTFFLGDKPSYADVQLFAALVFIKETFPSTSLSEYPKLVAVADQVKTNPGVAGYLASHTK